MLKKVRIVVLIIAIIVTATIPVLVGAKRSEKAKQDFANVVFFAYFRGDTEGKEYLINNYQDFVKMYEGEGNLSVKGYLNKVSYGKFNLINIFPQYDGKQLVPIELPCTAEDAEKSNVDYTIINTIISSISGINDNLDYDNDGYIDNFSIILKGGSDEVDSNTTLVSHKSDYGENDKWSNKKLGTYNMLNTYSISNSKAGVIAHEFLHSLGYPDLYTSNGTYPVYIWDIMGAVAQQMSYPLAYLRMKFTNWLTIDTITTSQTLTLSSQDNANGKQAYILKSPLNEYELFVVEFRKKPTDFTSLDRMIGNSGMIVYRIDTTVEGLNNNRGKTGVYVFRQESGLQDDATLRYEAYNASYSKEQGKTLIGSSDLNVTKGALTFSDGSNSGIVISNISSSKGDNMTIDVTIPDAQNYDTWKNTEFPDSVGGDVYTRKNADIISYNNKLYSVNMGNNKIYTHSYENSEWKKINEASMDSTSEIINASLLTVKNGMYLITSMWDKITLYKFSNNAWSKVTTLTDTNGTFAYKEYKDKLYLAKVHSDNLQASLYELNGNTFNLIGTYYKGSLEAGSQKTYAGTPKIEIMNDKMYIINNQSNGLIRMYEMKNNKFTEIETTMNSNQYDVVTLNNKIYFVLGSDYNNDKMRMVIYDGEKFEKIDTTIKLGTPIITVSQGNMYVLAIDMSATGKAIVYAYNENTGLTKEGIDVDNSADSNNLNIVSIKNNLYVVLRRTTDGTIVVKQKETVNSLKSISIIAPKKTTYIVGNKLDLTGLKVIANYKNAQKEVNDYTITGFDSSVPGIYDATITYEGVSNTFTYTIVEDVKEYTTLTEYLNKAGYKTTENFATGFKVNENISTIKNQLTNQDIKITAKADVISTGTEFSYLSENYVSVVYGDINGDGKINSADLLKMRQHLIGTSILTGAYKKAAALVNGSTINSADLLRLRQHLLGIKTILQ